MRTLIAALLSGAVLCAPAPAQEPASAEGLLRFLERRARETGDPADPRAAAARLGFDRAKILDFVRTEVAWEPYGGILRDASGTLLVRAGNPVDRALLLQSMLEAGGEKTRLLKVDLPAAEAEKLMAEFRSRDARIRLDRPDEDAKALAREIGVEAGPFEAIVAQRRRSTAAFVDEILEAARAEAARLEAALGERPSRPVEPPREHVWVQAWDGVKKDWVDLDPSTVAIPHQGGRPMAPAELVTQRRTISWRLVLNRKSGGKTESLPLLQAGFDLSAVAWKAVDLAIVPDGAHRLDPKKLKEMDDKARLDAVLAVKVFRATLRVDGRHFGAAPFDLSGNVFEVDRDGRTAAAKAMGRGVGNAFGGALGGGALGGGGGEAAPAFTFESLVLETTVKGAGGPEEVHRRTIAAPAAPGETLRALPLTRVSFLVDGAPLPAGERGRREISALAQKAEGYRKLLQEAPSTVRFKPRSEVSPLLLRFADLRRRILARLAEGAAPLQSRPGIVAETEQLWVDEAAARIRVRHGIDILDNPVVFVKPDGAVAQDRARIAGTAETALECLLLARVRPGETGRSAWPLLERARLQGGKPEVQERGGRIEVRWAGDAWWSVDPSTGGCVGRVPSGAGQGLVEHALETAENICSISDIAEVFSSQNVIGEQWERDAAGMLDNACDQFGGVGPREFVKDQILDRTKGMWQASTDALAGG